MTTITGIDPRRGRAVDVLVSDGRIVEVRESAVATELFVATGLIDLQVNGFGGHDLNEAELRPETVLHVAETVLQTGVTTFLPTLITQSEERLLASLRAIREALERFPLVRRMVAGVHMEGPFLSPEEGYRGAHLQEHVRPPDLHEVARWQAACGDLIRLITLSPHWDDVGAVIAELRRRGIQVALGHTHADAAQVHAAAEAGATLSTHLGNGIAATLARHPNAIWAQLADDRLSATFIADGHHLDRDTLRAMLCSKGETRSILISDAVALAGMPPGIYDAAVGGRVELSAAGRLGVEGKPYLAGAACSLAHGVGWLLEATDVTLEDAISLVTSNPARFLGRRGSLEEGEVADVVVFRSDARRRFAIEEVWLGGDRVHREG